MVNFLDIMASYLFEHSRLKNHIIILKAVLKITFERFEELLVRLLYGKFTSVT